MQHYSVCSLKSVTPILKTPETVFLQMELLLFKGAICQILNIYVPQNVSALTPSVFSG